MDNYLFQKALLAYEGKDYEEALNLYDRCLRESVALAPGESGKIYHQIGNCLVKMKNPGGAIEAYNRATQDEGYAAVGALNYNLGMTYASLFDYDSAVGHFETAIGDPHYDASYKAYSALGNALLKQGKTTEAGVAFREAALSEDNPDPTKALLNLGICFMSLGRPADAIASYESALQFPMAPDVKNKMFANMGQAYVTMGRMQEAQRAFENALADKTYFLSDSAMADYQRAVAYAAKMPAEATQAMPSFAGDADISGIDVSADGVEYVAPGVPGGFGAPYPGGDPSAPGLSGTGAFVQPPYGVDAQEADDHFFSSSDEELEQWSKGLAKQDRKRRNVGLKILIALLIVVLIGLGVAVFLYVRGFGFPSQEKSVKDLFADPTPTNSALSADVSQNALDTMLATMSGGGEVTIDGIDKGMSQSTVYATAKIPEGGDVQYKISLVRDKVGWKISDIDLYFASQKE